MVDLLSEHPTLAGTVVVDFVIAGDGTVSSATAVSDTLDHPTVASCVTDRLLRLRFPMPGSDAPVTATYPLVFRSD